MMIISKSNAISINLPPYIPSILSKNENNDQTSFTFNDIQNVMNYSKNQLSSLLATSFVVFWTTVIMESSKITSFLDSYLSQCSTLLKSTPFNTATNTNTDTTLILTDEELSKLVLFLILRLTLLDEEPELDHHNWKRSEWAESLYKTHIMSVPAIMDFAFIYGKVNTPTVSRVMHSILDAHPSYIQEFLEATRVLNGPVKHMERKREKSSSSNTGTSKGKGKPATEEVTDMSHNSVFPGMEAAQQEIDFLIESIWAFESTISVGGMGLSTALLLDLHESGVMSTLLACYSITSLIQTQYNPYNLANSSSNGATNYRSDTDTVGQNNHNEKATDDTNFGNCMTLAARAKVCKEVVLTFLYNLLDEAFFKPCKLDQSDAENLPIQPSKASEKLCDLIHILLDQSHFDEPVGFLHGAPLLVDLEIEYDLSNRLRLLKDVRLNGDDVRIDYILASLEQLLTFSGNAETKRVKMVRKMERKQRIVYDDINHTKDVFNRTINTPVINTYPYPPPMPMDEDYVRRSSLISQVQDLFPDLGEGFIEACLLAFDDNAELVIMKILEEDLPDYVKKLDRQTSRTAPSQFNGVLMQRSVSMEAVVDYSLKDDVQSAVDEPDSILSNRHNVFDGDEFDVFSRRDVDYSKISMGKKDKTSDLFTNKDEEFLLVQKERYLLSSVYDDEYDDTYDSQDVKLAGTVELHSVDELESSVIDSAALKPSSALMKTTENDPYGTAESYLIKMYNSHSNAIFEKNSRKSTIRNEMKKVTHLTDEQIEGWFRILQRDPDRMDSVLGPIGIDPNPNHQLRDEQGSEGSSEEEGNEEDDTHRSTQTTNERGSGDHRESGGGGLQNQGKASRNSNFPLFESIRGRAYKDRHKARYANHDRKQASWKKHRGAFFGNSRGSGTDSEA